MSRPADWSPLGQSSDPVPGDPLQVRVAAARYRGTATAVSDAIDNLRRIDLGNVKSLAFTASLDKIKEMATKLDQVEARVSGAASALEYYAPVLERAQVDSLRLLEQANGQLGRRRQLDAYLANVANAYNGSADPVQRQQLYERYQAADRERSAVTQGVMDARQRLQGVIDSRNGAADYVISQLDDIEQSSPVKDTFWDKAVDWYEKNVEPVLRAVSKAVAEFADKYGNLIEIVGAVVAIAAGIAFPGVGWVVATAVFASISAVFSYAKMGRAYFEFKDGKITAEDLGKVCIGETISIGLAAVGTASAANAATKLVGKPLLKAMLTTEFKTIAKATSKELLKNESTESAAASRQRSCAREHLVPAH